MKNKNKTIFLLGGDSSGWSIDSDRENIKRAMIDAGFCLVNNPFQADIFYVVWWNKMFKWSYRLLNLFFFYKVWIVTATNELDYQKIKVKKIDKKVDYWVVANSQQRRFLLSIGREKNSIFHNPFYVDETKIKKLNLNREAIIKKLNIARSFIEGRFLIGSFQKDSLGRDLSKSKWQKGPELLLDILGEMKKENILLILAGPRRHYLVKECKKRNIPFLFVGDNSPIKTGKDDCVENNMSTEEMNLLYNLVDLYLVTSKSEGGPKAVIEAPLTKTAILSTRVGFAPDFLEEDMLCDKKEEFIEATRAYIQDKSLLNKDSNIAYLKVSKVNNYESFKERVIEIIAKVSNEN